MGAMLNGRNFLGKLSDSQVFHASETLGWMEVDVERWCRHNEKGTTFLWLETL